MRGARPLKSLPRLFSLRRKALIRIITGPQGKVPLLAQENLGLPRNDLGIESVYLNQTQQYDARQCKFRTGQPTLGWEELATFVAPASSDKFQNKVLFTNCGDVVPILRDRVVLIRGSRLDQLTP